jgi:hypothetical protein
MSERGHCFVQSSDMQIPGTDMRGFTCVSHAPTLRQSFKLRISMRRSPVSRPLAIWRHPRSIIDARTYTASGPKSENTKSSSDPIPSSSTSSVKRSYSELFDSLRTTARTQAQNISALANEHITRLQVREKLGALGGRLNEVTGYEEIERLKDEVNNKGRSPIESTSSRT